MSPTRDSRTADARQKSPAGAAWSDAVSESRIAASQAFFVTDERQRVQAWSDGAERLLGFTAAEAEGRLCYEVLIGRHPDGHPVCGRTCPVTRNAKRGRGTAPYEVLATTRDGSTRLLSSNVVVLEEKRGHFRVVHLVHEMAARRSPRATAAPAPDGGPDPCAERLTRRELEVLRLMTQGATVEEVAASLGISAFTARNHVTNVEHKLGVRSRVQMVLEGIRRGLV